MFTGQAKIDFEKWLNQDTPTVTFWHSICVRDSISEWFKALPFSMQSGVYLEWLRSVGIWIECQRGQEIEHEYTYVMIILDKDDNILAPFIRMNDYPTALTEAIKQAVNIYNGGVK